MKKIVYTWLSVALLIGFMTGCESKEEKEQVKQAELFKEEQIQKAAQKVEEDKKVAKVAKEAVTEKARLAAIQAENPSAMNKMGVSMEEGKLTIDTNKAKEFFTIFKKKLDDTSEQIDKEIREGNLTLTIPVGIEVTNRKVSIDINKTKSFLDSWGERMTDFAKEFDTMTKTLHNDTQGDSK